MTSAAKKKLPKRSFDDLFEEEFLTPGAVLQRLTEFNNSDYFQVRHFSRIMENDGTHLVHLQVGEQILVSRPFKSVKDAHREVVIRFLLETELEVPPRLGEVIGVGINGTRETDRHVDSAITLVHELVLGIQENTDVLFTEYISAIYDVEQLAKRRDLEPSYSSHKKAGIYSYTVSLGRHKYFTSQGAQVLMAKGRAALAACEYLRNMQKHTQKFSWSSPEHPRTQARCHSQGFRSDATSSRTHEEEPSPSHGSKRRERSNVSRRVEHEEGKKSSKSSKFFSLYLEKWKLNAQSRLERRKSFDSHSCRRGEGEASSSLSFSYSSRCYERNSRKPAGRKKRVSRSRSSSSSRGDVTSRSGIKPNELVSPESPDSSLVELEEGEILSKSSDFSSHYPERSRHSEKSRYSERGRYSERSCYSERSRCSEKSRYSDERKAKQLWRDRKRKSISSLSPRREEEVCPSPNSSYSNRHSRRNSKKSCHERRRKYESSSSSSTSGDTTSRSNIRRDRAISPESSHSSWVEAEPRTTVVEYNDSNNVIRTHTQDNASSYNVKTTLPQGQLSSTGPGEQGITSDQTNWSDDCCIVLDSSLDLIWDEVQEAVKCAVASSFIDVPPLSDAVMDHNGLFNPLFEVGGQGHTLPPSAYVKVEIKSETSETVAIADTPQSPDLYSCWEIPDSPPVTDTSRGKCEDQPPTSPQFGYASTPLSPEGNTEHPVSGVAPSDLPLIPF